jgi:Clp amino terminal domain, pathogenicity island component
MDMANHPAQLDELIKFTLSRHPDGDALQHLTDAVAASEQLGEVADHLVGHFVDQARRAGASWTDIGHAMGVSKQAAQRRFVPRIDVVDLGAAEYERFTDRARRVVEAALAEARRSSHDAAGSLHLLVGLLTESEGLAARAIEVQGGSLEQVRGAATVLMGQRSAAHGDGEIPLGPDSIKALQLALREALRLGHNYIGTEHILLGILRDEKAAAATALKGLGITREGTERWVLAALEGWRRAKQSG